MYKMHTAVERKEVNVAKLPRVWRVDDKCIARIIYKGWPPTIVLKYNCIIQSSIIEVNVCSIGTWSTDSDAIVTLNSLHIR